MYLESEYSIIHYGYVCKVIHTETIEILHSENIWARTVSDTLPGTRNCIIMKKMDYSTPCFPVLHHLLDFAQTHVHWVIDDIQPSHPLLSPFSCLQSFIALGSFLMSCFLHLVSFNFLAVVTLHSTFGVQEKKKSHCFHFFPYYMP